MSVAKESNITQKDNSGMNNLEINNIQLSVNEKNKQNFQENQNKKDLKELSIQIEENYNQYQNKQIKKKQFNLPNISENCLKYLDNLDKRISKPLHTYSPSFKIECFFYCFARLFNIDTVIIYLVTTLIYSFYKYKNGYIALIPICHVICGALFTLVSKNVIKRPRPILITKRYFSLKEKSHSMPSGDSLQAGIFATMIILYFNNSFRYFSILLIPAAMSGRMFYNLHYFFDCLIGAIIGITISILTYVSINKIFF